MEKILGLDLGSHSIGWNIRDTSKNEDQFVHKGVITFEKGVGEEKGSEVPMVKARTQARGKRRNYQAEKYRKWELLKCLIENENKMCPLDKTELQEWQQYKKGQEKKYPQALLFHKWLALDFDFNSKVLHPQYENPYQLRRLAVENKIDNPMILGRIFYHLVQRRGFKGRDNNEARGIANGTKDSPAKGANTIKPFFNTQNPTLGTALQARQEETGERIRVQYTFRKGEISLEKELELICKKQEIDTGGKLYKKLWKAIIWQRPLRSQKGEVGFCTLERMIKDNTGKIIQWGKKRIAESHPDYEQFRAWQLINNLKIANHDGEKASAEWLEQNILPVFEKKGRTFKLSGINKACKKDGYKITANYNVEEGNEKKKKRKDGEDAEDKSDSFASNRTCWLLKEYFGNNWRSDLSETNKANGKIKHSYIDIWHIFHTADDKEFLEKFALTQLGFNELKAKEFSEEDKLMTGYGSIGYTAVNKITPFLKKGFIYDQAVLLANIPTILKRNLLADDEIEKIISAYKIIKDEIDFETTINRIINKLIAEHKALPSDEIFWYYEDQALDETDIKNVLLQIENEYGVKEWNAKEGRQQIQAKISDKYLNYLKGFTQRKYYTTPKILDKLKEYLIAEFKVSKEQADRLYHHSNIKIYPKADNQLGSPVPPTRGFKQPMSLKTLHKLKLLINYLIETEKIDTETRVSIELARDLNDANKRAAHTVFRDERTELRKDLVKEMSEISDKYKLNVNFEDEETLRRFILWKEQCKQCLYCTENISCTDVFDSSVTQLEHTIPASLSFCNELWNLTLSHTHCNQSKNKRIPKDLGVQYDKIISGKIKYIEEKKNHYENLVNEALARTKRNKDNKAKKDEAIQERHYYQMHYEYWLKKWETFTIDEYKANWHKRQLVDTQTSTKYALHWLKSYFNKVDVQRGEITYAFREIFGMPEKDRNLHSHHAMDAAVLCCIPKSPIREKYLKAYYECKDDNMPMNRHWFFKENSRLPYDRYEEKHYLDIQHNTLINNIKTDRTTKQSKKYVRKRGEKVPLIIKGEQILERDENGNILYKRHRDGKLIYKKDKNGEFIKDETGNLIPVPLKKYKIAQGNTIRESLHKDKFYAAIMQPQYKEVNKKFIPVTNEEGKFIFQKNESRNDEIFIALRIPITDLDEQKKLDYIIEPNLKRYIQETIEERLAAGISYENAIAEPIWAFGKKRDKKNNPISPIRHIRCKVKSGGRTGFLNNPVEVKERTSFLSKHKHKNQYYAQNDTNPVCLFYEGQLQNKIKRFFKIISSLEISKLKIKNLFELKNIELYNRIRVEAKFDYIDIKLKSIIKEGTKVIYYKDSLADLKELNCIEILKRTFRIYKFNEPTKSTIYIYLQHHLEARPDKELGKPENEIDLNKYQPRLFLTPDKFTFAIEDIDFETKPDGEIKWKF